MQIGLNLPVVNPEATPSFLREVAQRAEELGFAELYLGEHVVLFDDPQDEYRQSDDGAVARRNHVVESEAAVAPQFENGVHESARLRHQRQSPPLQTLGQIDKSRREPPSERDDPHAVRPGNRHSRCTGEFEQPLVARRAFVGTATMAQSGTTGNAASDA